MKNPISLKWFVVLSFLIMAVVLIIGYSVLSVKFFFKGMDNIVAGHMVHVLESYIKATPEYERGSLTRFSGFMIAKQWQQMPENIKEFIDCPHTPGKLSVYKDGNWLGKPRHVVFAMSLQLGNETYYVVHRPPAHKTSPLIGNKGKENLRMLLGISLLTASGIAVLVWILLKLVERPVKSLGQWAHGLDADRLKAHVPDFIYPELNELARLIQESLSSVQESLDREHKFLRHASHELRTPISVIRNNVELLKRLNEVALDTTDTDPKQIAHQTRQKNKIIDRIDRAGLTMKHLTQTLLWLGQNEQVQLPVADINLEHLVLELAEEAGYLLRDKDVEVLLDTVPAVMTLAQVPARIVTGNLIRNAFQHTWCGQVRIIQTETCVQIINDIPGEDDTVRDLGFGLGLQLTRQLCDRLGWSYTSREEDDLHRACIVFCETEYLVKRSVDDVT
ncbi:sensor histidine kinase [Desulfobacter hydrogenophilus]|uniref:histidine kinase n=1 Tax=Desulfobacter hydrogenophilus TaxID=2291 RepID=A0A328FCD8_9BACT|nr:HAMP domain-containing sensor histidine kinase [Desulfobacter hydrogenophilus]NDY72233.1 HAMP domain-containing histidine kinase [Desulfobacter hydrogenophilus]RAM02238.1 sensor histidine kinase [Desulfobacter hydrogenophilus]